jgi:hypothetical protein
MIMGDIALDADGDGRRSAMTGQRAPGKVGDSGLYPAIDCRMNSCSHDVFLSAVLLVY